jgi:hypothetical protein
MSIESAGNAPIGDNDEKDSCKIAQQINAVVVGGNLIPKSELQQRLATVEAAANRK